MIPITRLPQSHHRPLQPSTTAGTSSLYLGTPLCDILPAEDMEAVVYVPQGEIAFIEEGQTVRLKAESLPGVTLTGAVRDVSRMEVLQAPLPLMTAAGGELPTSFADEQETALTEPHYEVRVALKRPAHGADPTDLLRSGIRGRAKIECGRRTCFDWLWRELHALLAA